MIELLTSKPIEKGDNLFELIFELDRRLQSSQNRQSPLSNLLDTFSYLEIILGQVQTDIIDTIFLKLINFFIKCNCNYKRLVTTQFLLNSSKVVKSDSTNWMIKVSLNNSIESLKRICSLWDYSFASDFETCNQILNLFKSCSSIFYSQPAVYGIFFESFNEEFLDSSILISTTLEYFEHLFDSLKGIACDSVIEDPDVFIKNSNFSSLIIQNSKVSKYFNDKNLGKDAYKIVLIASIMSGKRTIDFPNGVKESLTDLIQYL